MVAKRVLLQSKGSMSGSNVEETREQTHGRETTHTTCDGNRKEKSRDAFSNIEARLPKVELAMVDTWEGMDLIKQGIEDLKEQSKSKTFMRGS